MSRQAEVSRKHRKASSQPSSCSQNTESSSTTPEPAHESSDNEGDARRRWATQKTHTTHRTSECDGFTTVCVCVSCPRVSQPVCTVQQGDQGDRPDGGLHLIHTEDPAGHPEVRRTHTHTGTHTVHAEVRGFVSSCPNFAEVDCHQFSADRLLIKTGLVKL